MESKTIYIINEVHKEHDDTAREQKIAERLAEIIKQDGYKIKTA